MTLSHRRSTLLASVAVLALLVVATVGLAPVGRASASNPLPDEWDFLTMMNRERRTNGLPPLAMVTGGRDVARGWSGVMAGDGRLRHNPDMVAELASRFSTWRRVGENVGVGSNVAQLHSAFMASPGHRANVLGNFTYAGVGVRWAGDRLWVTVNFLETSSPVAWITRTPVTRVGGASDSDTSVLMSRRRPTDSADGVVIARADVFSDALTGGPLATVQQGTVLLSPPDAVPDNVVAEAGRVLKATGTVYLLGGPAALSPSVEARFATAGLRTVRLAGSDRFSTAVAVADRVNSTPTEVFVVSGLSFPDAVVSGPAAGARRSPILLVAPGEVPAATAAYLAARRPPIRLAVGGTSAVSEGAARAAGVTSRIAGADRYATAVAVAQRFFGSANTVMATSGLKFTDALTASPDAARNGMALVLTAGSVPQATYDYVAGQVARWGSATVTGNGAALPDDVVVTLFS